MTVLGIELNDAAIAIVDGDSERAAAPGYAVATKREILVGRDAWKVARLYPRQTSNRFWRDLSDQPLTKSIGGQTSAADLVHAQLERLLAEAGSNMSGDGAIFAVPAHWTPEQLGLLLGIVQDLGLPVTGLVDSAVAATRREYRGGILLHLDATLHDATISEMRQSGRVSVGERRVVDHIGIEGLERTCVEFIARQFVSGTRFDPLHDGKSEQYIYDNLYAWLERLNREKTAALTVEFGGNEFQTTVQRPELAERIIEYLEPVIQQMRNMLSVGVSAAVQVGNRLAIFPGVVEAVAHMSQVSVFIVEPAAAAKGALHRATHLAPAAEGIRLTTSLPWDQPPVDLTEHAGEPGTAAPPAVERPTHVLFHGHAYKLERRAFRIGSELAPGEYGIALDAGVSGVSRSHCTIRIGSHGVEVLDHSRYGTRLNGHTIDEAAILQSGDILTLGNPAREFLIITEVTSEFTDQAEPNGTQKN